MRVRKKQREYLMMRLSQNMALDDFYYFNLVSLNIEKLNYVKL